jgi:hypothetical protein
MHVWTVVKRTGSHADVLAAIGAADALQALKPALVDCGDRFEIRLSRALVRRDLARIEPGYLYLPKSATRPRGLPAARVHNPRSRASTPDRGSIDPVRRIYGLLGRLNAAAGPNEIVRKFVEMPASEWREKLWNGFNGDSNFVTRPKLVQLFNPLAAQGYARLKPSGTNRADKTKNHWRQPFLEWLRYRGFVAGGAGWFLEKDVRVFCLVPGNISYHLYRDVALDFRQLRLAGSTAKVDCRAVLGLAIILLNRAGSVAPGNLIAGVSVVHYRNMGKANAFMASDCLAVPDCFDEKTLYEHDRILKGLSDRKSEEASLLRQYRAFLQSNREDAIRELVAFLANYGRHAFRRSLEGPASPATFTIRGTETILGVHMTYRQMLDNDGFRAVANALRAVTVNAVVAKYNKAFEPRRIRYGILTEIDRSLALGKHELMATVSRFIMDYNTEAAQRCWNGRRDARITDQEAAEFAHLLDEGPSAEVVGTMLCAFGTCQLGEPANKETRARRRAGYAQAISA